MIGGPRVAAIKAMRALRGAATANGQPDGVVERSVVLNASMLPAKVELLSPPPVETVS